MRGVLGFAALAAVLVGCWLAGTATAQQGGISPAAAAERQHISILRHSVATIQRRKCLPPRWRPYVWPNVADIPRSRLYEVRRAWQLRERRVHRSSSRCPIPAWPWLALASCESGRDWSYNGPSGFDGGFQFLPSTWTMAKQPVARGRRYGYAWQAPAYVQYLVARSWLARTSWLQWPACSRRIGAR